MGFLTNITSLATRATGIYVDGYPKDVHNDQGNVRGGGTLLMALLLTNDK